MLNNALMGTGKAARRIAWEGERLRWRLFHPVTVGARIILLRQDQVLLIEHTYQRGWFLPGGGVDKGESLEECVRREAGEEAGARVHRVELVGIYSNFEQGKTDHMAIFVSQEFDFSPPKPGNEIARYAWFGTGALPGDLWPGTERRIAEALAGERGKAGRW